MKDLRQVFIDMDGVVSAFDEHLAAVYGISNMREMTNKQRSRFWDVECVSKRFFANCSAIPGGMRLVYELEQLDVPICFLTSTGGGEHHHDIAKQKLDFLQRHGLSHLPVAFATGTQCKAAFANPHTLLIDDREKVTTAFEKAGGAAILFTPDNWGNIVEQVKVML